MTIDWTPPKAALAGVCVFILGQALYFQFSNIELLRPVLLGTPGFSAFVATYFSPRWKVLVGMSMAIFGAALGLLMTRVYVYFGGYVDQIGGFLATFVTLFAYYFVLSVVGTALGKALSYRKASLNKKVQSK